jgi:hypothetical protein
MLMTAIFLTCLCVANELRLGIFYLFDVLLSIRFYFISNGGRGIRKMRTAEGVEHPERGDLSFVLNGWNLIDEYRAVVFAIYCWLLGPLGKKALNRVTASEQIDDDGLAKKKILSLGAERNYFLSLMSRQTWIRRLSFCLCVIERGLFFFSPPF